MPDLFADSFGLVACLEGNPRYVIIFRHRTLATTALNILELYATLAYRVTTAEARELSAGSLPMVQSIPGDVALPVGEFRLSMRARRRDYSYIDTWGYAAVRPLGVPLLTGDPAFKPIDHVEFVR